jgi:hypothetical protein
VNVRCVVTGQAESGKAVFVPDGPVEPITLSVLPGFEFCRLWGCESGPEASQRRHCTVLSAPLSS